MNSRPTTRVVVPYRPRPQQNEVACKMRKARFGVLVCHRRFGKTVLGVNLLQQGATMNTKERPRYGYIGPTYRQSKSTAWDYVQHFARPITDQFNQSELRVDYTHNGGQVRLFGADSPDNLRGIYLDGAVLDEFGMHPRKTFSEVIGPTLVDRGGWALFEGTPNGHNQFHEMAMRAQQEEADGNPDWFYAEFKASQTGLLDPDFLSSQRALMSEDEYNQEFECSFSASVRGAIYSKEMQKARDDGRITRLPLEPLLPVDTDWDLGIGDSMTIWFSQSLRTGEVRLIDYYENSGEGIPHYIQLLHSKGYTYGAHWAPHDIKVRELGTGKSRWEAAHALGVTFRVVPQLGLEDGIAATRLFLARCWWDADKCKQGLDALMHYRREYNYRLNEFKPIPVHDHASHAADSFRGLAVRHRTPESERKIEDYFRGGLEKGTTWMGR